MTSKVTTADELRDAWFAFFEERDHARYPSDSLVPENDPTLLFTGAGMNQFKAMFVGKGNLPHTRVSTIQKCFRQGDLENVGRTPRHLTFFEMLGHFSFGDYFKKEAVLWAWTFLTDVLEIPPDKLWVSIYEDDDEAHAAWRAVGVAEDRIQRFDARENFWPADAPAKGPNGVCGPCSEIFYDYGPEREAGDGGPAGYDSGRFVEIWNTVFTQFERVGENDLRPLPQKNIDCGAGFERILAVLEGEYSPFGTSLFRPIIRRVADLAGATYDFEAGGGLPRGEDARRMRRIAEHARAACMLGADGVKPSNEGRGYVLRRVLRRAIRDGIQLGLTEPFLGELVEPVIHVMGEAHPGLREGRAALEAALQGEDERFRETYAIGLRYLEDEVDALGGQKVLPGAAAFKLYDTYGFPLDLAQNILAERGIAVDAAGFDVEMERQRARARAGSNIQKDIFAGGPLAELQARKTEPTAFLGYDGPGLEGEGRIVGLIEAETNALVELADEGTDVTVVLDRTPFYAESGGQVGDIGTIETPSGRVDVLDTQQSEGYHLHLGKVAHGRVESGQGARARVDGPARDATRRNHTATHLLHEALKRVLGDHVRQEGSLVAPDRLRFDFSHPQALTPSELQRLEDMVNDWILANDEVETEVLPLDEAKASGAVSLFGEKYADVVRVLSVESGSRELCGGTHCRRTGDIGSFRITQETSIAAGVRRLEAVTGQGAVELASRDRDLVRGLGLMLKAKPEELTPRIQTLQEEVRTLRKAGERARAEAGHQVADQLAAEAETVAGLKIQVAAVPGVEAKALKGVWERLQHGGVQAALLVGEADGKAPILAALVPEAVERGLDAKRLLQAATAILGGGGGGRPPMAQGQGQDRSRIPEAIEAVRDAIQRTLESEASTA